MPLENLSKDEIHNEIKFFVTVGTTAFDELLENVDKLPTKVKTKIVCQVGPSNYTPSLTQNFKFDNHIDLFYKSAEYVICHAGAGTVFSLLGLHKKKL